MPVRTRLATLLLAALAVAAAVACSDDDGSGGDGAGPAPEGSSASDLDTNGDGRVLLGIAAAGPRDDGAYYEAVVATATEVAAERGFAEPIVVDEITPADAAAELENLAEQGVDVIIVGAGEIAEPLPDLTERYPDIFWYCNCGAGFDLLPGLAQSIDDPSEVGFTAGYATGLALEEVGGDRVLFLGCCDLPFEREFLLAFELGLQGVSRSYEVVYVGTGDFPYDFDNVPNATEALNAAIAGGTDAVMPYLGGAHRPIVALAAAEGLITMSAGASDACEDPELDYDIEVRFDGGDYFRVVLDEILSGELEEGEVREFRVGVDAEPGAAICDPTGEQQAALDAVYERIAAGELADAFTEIKTAAYSGG